MFRPRALNMNDHLVQINGQPMNGGLMDFAVLMFKNAKTIIDKSPSFVDRQVEMQTISIFLKKRITKK